MPAIRTSTEITLLINKSLHALADLGNEIVIEKKRGITITKVTHRDKVLRLILIRAYLQNILEPDGSIFAYYLVPANEKKFNQILDGLLAFSKGFDGPAIPLIGQINLPLYFFPGTSGASSSAGGGPAVPGGTTFQANVDSPSQLIDTFDASISTFAMYLIGVNGSNSGEGSRTSIVTATWRGSNAPGYNETKTEDIGGITTPITFKVELVAGKIQLNAYATTDNWTVTGVRILFQNISFVNPIGPLPAGGTTGQALVKASNLDYSTLWVTLTANLITDLLASATELNFSQGVTSAIQTQFNTLVSNLATEATTRGTADTTLQTNITNEATTRTAADLLRLLLTGGTMSGNIAMGGNKVTGLAAATGNGEAVRFEQLSVATAVIAIGDWNIVSSITKPVAHGLVLAKIRHVSFSIISDDGTIYLENNSLFAVQNTPRLLQVDATNVNLSGTTALQTTNWDATGYNRGYVVIQYDPT